MTTPGVVFTRDWVADFVLDIAGYTSDRNLTLGCIVEPSCGDGAFLRRIVTRLCDSAQRHDAFNPTTLLPCVRAYDIDASSIIESKRVVVDVLVRAGMLHDEAAGLADVWVRMGDFLLSEVPCADWVVGNPPYVRASMLPRELREEYRQRLTCVTMGTDLYVGFFEKGLKSLTATGSLCFICSDRWLQNRYGGHLREFVSAGYSLEAHVRMHGVKAFEDDVSAYPAVSLIRRGPGRPLRYMECCAGFSLGDVPSALQWILGDDASYRSPRASADVLPPLHGNQSIPLAPPDKLRLLDKAARRWPRLEDAGVRLGIGVASGCDAVYITEDPDLVERERLLPIFFMRDWRAGTSTRLKYLVNPWMPDGTLVDLGQYPRLARYFEAHRSQLSARRVARDHPQEWYRTLDRPDMSLLGSEMLLFPDMASRADPVYSDGTRYPHHNCYWMTSDSWGTKALGGLMMSDIVESFVDAYGVKMRGSTLRFQAQYLRMVHIPRAEDVDMGLMHELAASFEVGDRERASAAARRAYGLEDEYAG